MIAVCCEVERPTKPRRVKGRYVASHMIVRVLCLPSFMERGSNRGLILLVKGGVSAI
jgi:hypothetical protein